MLLDVVYFKIQVIFGDTESCVLQEDIAPPHTAKVCRAIRKELSYCLLPWVPQSPDLNPIENAWDYLEWAIRAMNPQPKTQEDLIQALSDAWGIIPQSYFVSSGGHCASTHGKSVPRDSQGALLLPSAVVPAVS